MQVMMVVVVVLLGQGARQSNLASVQLYGVLLVKIDSSIRVS